MEKEENRERAPENKLDAQEKEKLEGLPVDTSPYTKYKDLEDYKSQGYGTQGHLEPKTGRGGGATDAPTFSGEAAPSKPTR